MLNFACCFFAGFLIFSDVIFFLLERKILSGCACLLPFFIYDIEFNLKCRREQDVRVASQLLTLMDSNKSSVPQVVVVASTNR